ncbi:hypothetical protein NVP1285O_65 [Vibrio phage 1.285.O._10N.286.55.C12]|nr:hypothetical protein NVP1088O_60 [Vibrio phage 1.088.O._10N.261.46.A1]AUS01463.1 hypothetical protein NVP1285O_65 [Vibrio phage 1.285.O._10N.286.55.C12]
MKLVIMMQVVDEENNVLAEQDGHIANFEKLDSFSVGNLVRQWVGEKIYSLKVAAITSGIEDNTSDK